MGDDDRVPATVEAALARIEGSLGEGFADLRGQIALVLQRADQTDERLKDQARQLGELEARTRVLESTSATREAVKGVEDVAVTHEQLNGRFRRTTTMLTLVMTGLAIVIGSATTVLVTVLG